MNITLIENEIKIGNINLKGLPNKGDKIIFNDNEYTVNNITHAVDYILVFVSPPKKYEMYWNV